MLEQHPLSAWHGIAPKHSVCAGARPSVAHPEHYDLYVLSANDDAYVSTKRPVKLGFVERFLDAMLSEFHLLAEDLEWRIETSRERFWRLNPIDAQKSYVYFISAGTFIKIGTALGNPQRRLHELQTGCPFEMALLVVMPGGQALERQLHQVFSAWRCRDNGEWFHNEGALAKYIAGLR